MTDPIYHDSAQYDAMYGDLVADIPLLVGLMRSAGGPVLEVCCGNGRVLVPMRRAGVDVDGLDLSPEMLDGLRAKLAAEGLSAGTHLGDMRDFSLPRRYARVLIAFNSLLHNLTQADQLAALRRCRAHLASGGRFVMVVFHPSVDGLVSWAAGEKLVKEVPNPNGAGRVRVRDHAVDDRVEQVRHVTRHIDYLEPDGTLVRTETLVFAIRYAYKPELELLLRVAGFTHWTVQPLDLDPATNGWVPASRTPVEGDMLLWTAWSD